MSRACGRNEIAHGAGRNIVGIGLRSAGRRGAIAFLMASFSFASFVVIDEGSVAAHGRRTERSAVSVRCGGGRQAAGRSWASPGS